MKQTTLISLIGLLLFSFMLGSCAAIEGIFKAGMGFGIFIVIAVIAIIVAVIMRIGKNKSR
jgi:hypothetical protein